ncbi:MAG: hypothetical protein GY874_09260 [Desulfobacteraceae bacterium]|nr:hypothetical protein [Desulfobacteraceae bacterium]
MKSNKTIMKTGIVWLISFGIVFYAGYSVGKSKHAYKKSDRFPKIAKASLNSKTDDDSSEANAQRNRENKKNVLKQADASNKSNSVARAAAAPPTVHPDESAALMNFGDGYTNRSYQSLMQDKYAMEESGIRGEDIENMLSVPESPMNADNVQNDSAETSFEQREQGLRFSLEHAGAPQEDIQAMIDGLFYTTNQNFEQDADIPPVQFTP